MADYCKVCYVNIIFTLIKLMRCTEKHKLQNITKAFKLINHFNEGTFHRYHLPYPTRNLLLKYILPQFAEYRWTRNRVVFIS